MKSNRRYEEELLKEREKLHQMIISAMDKPIAGYDAILKQSRKADALTMRLQIKGTKTDKKQTFISVK